MENNVSNEKEELKETSTKKVEENKKTSTRKTNKKGTTSKKVKESSRLTDVIEKMEEETQKVQKNKNIEDKQNQKSEKTTKESKALKTTKKSKKEMTEQSEQLEKVEEEIQKQTRIPKEKMNKLYGMVFENILYAIVTVIYFIMINMGYITIKQDIFMTDLKVFSITLIIITICMFEYAYKKDSGKYTIRGIELLILSVCTLVSMRIYQIYNKKFIPAITSVALLFAIYYVGRAIVIYIKEKKKAKKETREIYKISKKK